MPSDPVRELIEAAYKSGWERGWELGSSWNTSTKVDQDWAIWCDSHDLAAVEAKPTEQTCRCGPEEPCSCCNFDG